jgi:hypothetical protein
MLVVISRVTLEPGVPVPWKFIVSPGDALMTCTPPAVWALQDGKATVMTINIINAIRATIFKAIPPNVLGDLRQVNNSI